MTDIAPELLEKVRQSFEAETAVLKEKIAKGVKNYEEAYSYAIKVGEALSRSFGVNITPEVLPDGRMYYNIADKVVRPMLLAEHELTSQAAASAQRSVNRAAGIGIRPLEAEFDTERAQGIIDRVSSQPFEEIKWILNEPVKTFSKNVVDQTLEKNVEFQGKSGLSPKIRRTALGDACPWCQAVAGTYTYPQVPKDVYRRHANCDCVVEYLEGGKIQDVHSKVVYKSKAERDAAIQARIARAQEQMSEDDDARIFGRRKIGLDTTPKGYKNLDVPGQKIFFKEIKGDHSVDDDLKHTNPRYKLGTYGYTHNCQRSVITYEARRRGYEVRARRRLGRGDTLPKMNHPEGWPSAFEGGRKPTKVPMQQSTQKNAIAGIENEMLQYGQGSRAIVRVRWDIGGGHVFIAENQNGIIRYLDPQCGDNNYTSWQGRIKPEGTYIMRIDDLDFSSRALDCFE